jgi:hypothetical protein
MDGFEHKLEGKPWLPVLRMGMEKSPPPSAGRLNSYDSVPLSQGETEFTQGGGEIREGEEKRAGEGSGVSPLSS